MHMEDDRGDEAKDKEDEESKEDQKYNRDKEQIYIYIGFKNT